MLARLDNLRKHPAVFQHLTGLTVAVFDALAAGGRVTMPLQKTFWAEAFGMLVDRFGTPWMVSGGMASA